MSFEIALPIDGSHGIGNGPTSSGVWFGTIGPEEPINGFYSKIGIVESAGKVYTIDVNGVTTLVDASIAAGNVAPDDIFWPNATHPTDDQIQVEINPGRKLAGFAMWLTRPTDWTDSSLAWVVDYPSTTSMASVPINLATSTPPTILRTGVNGSLVSVMFENQIDTNNINPVPIPQGSSDAFWRRIRIRLSGTITSTGGTTFPAFGRIWPVYAEEEQYSYKDLTALIQPVVSPNFTNWPNQLVQRNGDISLLMCREWPLHVEMNVLQSSTTTGANTYVYGSSTGVKPFVDQDYANDPSDFGRASIGSYDTHYAKPNDAVKYWALTYTLDGLTRTILQIEDPALPLGAVLVRKQSGYLLGRRFDVSASTVVSAFHVTVAVRLLDPALMTTSVIITEASELKNAIIAPSSVTNTAQKSVYQVINPRTATGPIIAGTLTSNNLKLQSTGNSFSRIANDGVILVQVKGKTIAGAESTDGFVIVSG